MQTILGQLQVQKQDYAYTLQGWLKGINPAMGGTLANGTDTTEAFPVTQDVYGFSLHYYKNDYRAIDYSPQPASVLGALTTNAAPLYNGNIAAMAVNIPQLSATKVYNYHYDQLNRIVAMDMYNGLSPTAGTFTPVSDTSYKERVSYDPNGNILGYLRNGAAGSTMDSLHYKYYASTNKLSQVTDNISANKYPADIDNQVSNNYNYDAIGNMTSNASDSISNITWNVYGKIATITKNARQIRYTYDASGNRIIKQTPTDTTVYVRDGTGNVMSVYYKPANDTLVQSEVHLYGSSRLGMATQHLAPDTSVLLTGGFSKGIKSIFTRGEKFFELSNHLGNVLATISDRRIQADSDSDGTVDSYKADIATANDYYPFGMLMPQTRPDSLVYSCSFETGTDGWVIYNAGTLQNDNGRLKFLGTVPWSTPKKDLQLKTGKEYRVRFTIDMGNCSELHLPIYKADITSFETLSGVGLSITASGTYEGTFTATSNSMMMLFEMIPGVNPPPDSTGYYWLDNISVEEIRPGDSTYVGKGGYRYGFNSQEKSDEIAGAGNHTTALFGEYDTRIGRRWNPDPKPITGISIYSVFCNNPIWHSDILLDTPTVKEAVLMDKLVYGDKLSKEEQSAFDRSGWNLSNKVTGIEYTKKSGLKSALFERTIDGKTEYTYAFAGTEGLINKDAWNDLTQVVGLSTQIGQAINNTKEIVRQLGNAELTLSGHSLGGALANGSALATGKASITFNPAWISSATMFRYGLTFKPQSGITNYVILGEVLNTVQRSSNLNPIPKMNLLQNVGKTNYLYSAMPLVPIYGPLKSHTIGQVISEIKDVPEYNKVKGPSGASGDW